MEPIDKAIFKSMKKYHIDARQISTLQSIDFRPFDPVTKYVLSVVKDPSTGAEISACKGAVQSVLAFVEKENGHGVEPDHRRIYLQSIDEFAKRGFRSLGVALKTDAKNPWLLVGVLSLFHPPRDDSAQTIATAKSMGVKVKMLTGDQLAIAKETGHQLNMGTNMFDADKLQWTTASGAEIADCKIITSFIIIQTKPNSILLFVRCADIENADGFAQVFPEHKYKVVETLQGRGLIAMTGDGVNDALPSRRLMSESLSRVPLRSRVLQPAWSFSPLVSVS